LEKQTWEDSLVDFLVLEVFPSLKKKAIFPVVAVPISVSMDVFQVAIQEVLG
jgi:hypothetical protein